jgi:UDP-N-acetylglucosamine/UDP-N-acetylgalactosamine diphosphorylase
MPFDYSAVFQLLSAIGQQDLLQYWEFLAGNEQKCLLQQLQRLQIPILQQQQRLLSQSPKMQVCEPLPEPARAGNEHDQKRGRQLIADGKVGCLILAGGQGTRLGFSGPGEPSRPKGCYPISAVQGKSLFQLFAEKTLAASRQAGRPLPLAIMTSSLNHVETVDYFEAQRLFGLDPSQLCFFSQSSLPFLSLEGALFFETPGRLAEGPDGNGGSLRHFVQAGFWQHWYERGVRLLNLVLIDNPLADPFDAELFGYHQRLHSQVTVKCALKQHANEQVGVLTKQADKIAVLEYSELPEAARQAQDAAGQPLFKYANLSLFCVEMQFIKELADAEMPLHKALKEVKRVSYAKKAWHADTTMAWKFEKFIFDLLPYAEKTGVLLYPRESCFAPLKNLQGENSVKTVQKALQANDYRVFSAIAAAGPCIAPFEISQEFYYPTPALLSKWAGKHGPSTGYVD